MAARAGAIPEVVGDAAVLVDPLDPADLAAGLALVLDDDVLRAQLVAAGRERVQPLHLDGDGRRHGGALPATAAEGGAAMIAVLAGGVGAARFLAGLVQVVRARRAITAIVNTGDDTVLHGLTICPDLDTVTYTLAGAIDPERGWGLAGESWRAMGALDRFVGVRPRRLRRRRPRGSTSATRTWPPTSTARIGWPRARPLSTVTGEIAAAFGVAVRLAADDRRPRSRRG